jgi:hypothetical protein
MILPGYTATLPPPLPAWHQYIPVPIKIRSLQGLSARLVSVSDCPIPPALFQVNKNTAADAHGCRSFKSKDSLFVVQSEYFFLP